MRRALGAALLVTLLLAAPASARSPFHRVGKGNVWADGERLVAYVPDLPEHDPTQILDDVSGQRWQVQAPQVPDCYALTGVAGGDALWQCNEPDGHAPRLQELGSGVIRAVPGWEHFELWRGVQNRYWSGGPRDLGDRWLELGSTCYHCSTDLQYLDWHDGTFVSSASELPERTVDLDRPNFDIPLCAPLRRLPTFAEAQPPFVDAQYEPPWFLRWVDAPGQGVRLYHCGKRRPIPIARCKFPDCMDRQLGGGYLVWRDGGRVYSFDLHSRKPRVVGDMPAGTSTITHTSRRVYASGGGTIYAAPLPGRKR